MTTNFGGVDVVPLLGAIAYVVPLQGAIVVCYGSGGVTNFGGVDVVPLQGAIVVCYGGAGERDDQLWRSTWCHCRVPVQCAGG